MQRVIRAETLQTRANRSAGAIGQRAEKEIRWLVKQRNFGGRADVARKDFHQDFRHSR